MRVQTLMIATVRSKEWEGRTVSGKFPLRQWLGASDHSAVFLTERAGERAAIKFVPVGSDDEAERQLARWRRAARLSHPNLIRLFEFSRVQMDGHGYAYVVMEFADEDLSQILPQRALAPAEVSEMLPPLLGALSHLHAKGFAHGRIKPSNVLATGDRLKLSADQVSSLAAADLPKTRRNVYDAPETAAGILSPASDLWSVGVTLYVALTQNLPEGNAKNDPAQSASLPEPFRGIVRSCLQLDPKQRISIAGILRLLHPESASVGENSELTSAPRWSGNRIVLGLFVLVIALLIVFVSFFPSRRIGTQNATPTGQQPQAQASTETAQSRPIPEAQRSAPPVKRDAQGSVLHEALPEVSQSARNTISGKIRVVARVDVDATGKVARARLTTHGPSNYFARSVLQAAERWQFSPPVVNGQPVASAWSLTFHISRKETQVSPERLRH